MQDYETGAAAARKSESFGPHGVAIREVASTPASPFSPEGHVMLQGHIVVSTSECRTFTR
jgi:hypothetical protein